ncbi:MAG TPA: hypothetical protein VM324_11260 [Egibacteraceae bacterium]|nr:hypothetical protein [Egibacteraceae bacterium]
MVWVFELDEDGESMRAFPTERDPLETADPHHVGTVLAAEGRIVTGLTIAVYAFAPLVQRRPQPSYPLIRGLARSVLNASVINSSNRM